MKKIIYKLQHLGVKPILLIFLTIFAVSIFGFQISKINALNTSLSEDLVVLGKATIGRDLVIDGNLGLGVTPSSPLNVSGKSNVGGLVYSYTPGNSQKDALATVSYINARIDAIRHIRPPAPNPDPNPTQTCYWNEIPVPYNWTGPGYCESGYSVVEWYLDNQDAGGYFGNTLCCD